MKYTDHHVHTSWSPDSEAEVEAYVRQARALGLDYVLFTDHVDFGTRDPAFLDKPDYEQYFSQMRELSERLEFPIRVGVEIGYEKNEKGPIEAFVDRYPFEFVIASIHYGDGGDFYLGDFFTEKNRDEAYGRYFELVQEMAENFSAFDVAGHLDFITRYGPYEHRTYELERFSGSIDATLSALIAKGKGIEVNTSGLRSDRPRFFPGPEILARYRALGGRIITIGSDSHFNDHYLSGVPQAMDELHRLGFEAITSFSGRRPQTFTLDGLTGKP